MTQIDTYEIAKKVVDEIEQRESEKELDQKRQLRKLKEKQNQLISLSVADAILWILGFILLDFAFTRFSFASSITGAILTSMLAGSAFTGAILAFVVIIIAYLDYKSD